jgi:hypothetical protein
MIESEEELPTDNHGSGKGFIVQIQFIREVHGSKFWQKFIVQIRVSR